MFEQYHESYVSLKNLMCSIEIFDILEKMSRMHDGVIGAFFLRNGVNWQKILRGCVICRFLHDRDSTKI